MRSMVEWPRTSDGGLHPPPLHHSLRERSPSPSELGRIHELQRRLAVHTPGNPRRIVAKLGR